MDKTCNVVMLTTKKRSNIQMCSNNTLFWHDKPIISTKIGNGELYITSDEETKEGDWFYYEAEKTIMQCTEHNFYFTPELIQNYSNVYKIIVTTDTSLKLPNIPQQFIEKYIEEYNKGNVITKVMVEYDEMLQVRHGVEWYDLPNQTQGNDRDGIYQKVHRLKINPDNTINIKPIKDSWDLNEIKVFAVKCFNAGRQYQIDSIDIFNDKWVEENL